jgi:hypothetical protein
MVKLQKPGPDLSFTPACVAVVVSTSIMHFALFTHNATFFVFKLCAVSFTGCVRSASFTKIMVEQLLEVTSEYEERLRRCEYVPRFSFGRRILKDDGAPNRFILVYLFL